jgi:cbb3-type cytochrome oxidase subunit 3
VTVTTKRFVPWVVFAIFVAYVAASASQLALPRSNGFNLTDFRRLPVSVNGRVQPIDSVARISLQHIRGLDTVQLENPEQQWGQTTTLDPSEWLLEVLAKPDTADTRRIFPVSDRELIARLQLPATGRGTTYCAFRDFAPKVKEIGKEVERIAKIKATDRAAWERELIVLQSKLVMYERLKNSVQPNSLLQRDAKGAPTTFDFAGSLVKYRTGLAQAVRVAGRRRQGGTDVLDADTEQRLRAFSGLFQGMSRAALLAVVPPVNTADSRDHQWRNIGAAIVDSARGGRLPLAVAYFAAISSAFARGDADAFNLQAANYRRWLAANGMARETSRMTYEVFYNMFQPFARAMVIYAVGLCLLGVAWWTGSATERRSAAMLILLGVAVHTTGLLFALMLSGRPPVTNMYSLTISVGCGVALASLAMERFWRRGAGVAAAAVTGLGALVAAHSLTAGGAAALVQNVLDVRLIGAIVATVVVLRLGREPATSTRSLAVAA